MEQWLILCIIVNYIQDDKCPENVHHLNIRTVNKEKYIRNSNIDEGERHMLE